MRNTPTSSLPQATTTKIPPATFTTTNLPPAPTSNTTSHLPPVTSSTSHLLPSTSTARACNINEHMTTSTARACNINEADLFVVPVVGEENLLIEAEIEELDDVTMNEDVEANVILELGESDAQMLINKMENRKKFVPNFTFHYLVENSELVAMFWADEVAKCNYKEFGDIISFDATFRTNKYDMVFVPFTGIDNHLKCVNFGSGMLLREDTEAYTWLLTSFMTAHEKQPTMIVTDQDGAMKLAIEEVLTESKHRLCMWHIMQKIPAKILSLLMKSFPPELTSKMEDNHLKCVNFGSGMLLREDTEAYTWLLTSFMTAHEKQPTMVVTDQDGAMKRAIEAVLTESIPSKFMHVTYLCKKFSKKICPEIYDETDFKERFGKFVWNMFMEPTISLLVQKEIYEGVWACQIQDFKKEEGCEIVKVRDIRAGAYRTLYTEEGKETVIQEKDKVVDYKVVRNPEDGSVECTCRHFLRYGFLCRHVFCVLKNCNIGVIPERYILRRWRRDLIPPALRRNTNRYGEKDEAIEKLTNEANYVVDECLFLLRKDEEQLKQFVEKLENIKKEIQVKLPNPPSQKTGDVIEDIYAIKKPNQNLVNNPQKASNKGGRRGERRKSGREIAMKAKAKRARKCGYCAEITNKHTKTTCPLNPKYIAKLARTEAAAEQERRTAASATEQEERNSDTAHIVDKEQSNTAS
ncbi:zinc finger, SWIM-type containing protein [Tanacetum coccineum]